MAVSPRRQLQFWGIALAVFVAVLWLLGGTLLPFIAGAALAYFLDPLADRLERLGLGRAAATTVIAVSAVLALVAIMLLVVPELIEQMQGLIAALPDLLAQLIAFLDARFPGAFEQGSALRRNLSAMEETLRTGGLVVLNQVLAGSLRVLDFLLLLVVTPVVAFYLLLDWDAMVAKIDAALPRQHAPTIRRLAGEIDRVLAGFVRGQLSVCLILGAFYAVALMAIGLPFGFLVGLVAGLISFIPFVGSIVGLVLSVGIALFHFWDAKIWIVATAAIFFIGQFFEGNVLSPRLIGRSVGLHPVWLLLALSVFGALFGFAGLLVAVPVAAALGVLGRFAMGQYLASPLHTGRPPPPGSRLSMAVVRQLVLDLPARPALGRADFFVSPANRLALAQLDSWPDWPAGRLAVVGPAGSGKTHLAHVWAARSGARVLSAAALSSVDPAALPPDAALAVEDADRLAALPEPSRRRAEEALFHLCNRLSPGGSLMVSGRAAPARWRIALPDLASRLRAAAVARLEPPDDALLAAVLVKLFADRQIEVGPDLIRFLVARMDRSFEAAEALVARLDRAGLARHRPISARLAAEVLRAGTADGAS